MKIYIFSFFFFFNILRNVKRVENTYFVKIIFMFMWSSDSPLKNVQFCQAHCVYLIWKETKNNNNNSNLFMNAMALEWIYYFKLYFHYTSPKPWSVLSQQQAKKKNIIFFFHVRNMLNWNEMYKTNKRKPNQIHEHDFFFFVRFFFGALSFTLCTHAIS